MTRFEEHPLFGVEGLESRKNDLGRATSIYLVRRLIVSAHRKRKYTIASFRLHQAVAFDRHVVAGKRQALGVEALGIVIVPGLDDVQELVGPLLRLPQRRAQTLRQRIRTPSLQR